MTKQQPHSKIKEKTQTITYRLPVRLVEELDGESIQKGISHNIPVHQILEKYVKGDKFSDKIGMMPVPKGILQTLGMDMKVEDINTLVDVIKPLIKDNVMLMKGKYDLKRCIETLEDYIGHLE